MKSIYDSNATFNHMREEWKKWQEENPKIVKAHIKYVKKRLEIEGCYRGICGFN